MKMSGFTKRENEIVKLLTLGLSNKKIAESTGISEFTVKAHRRNIMKKSGCKNIIELIYSIGKNEKLNEK